MIIILFLESVKLNRLSNLENFTYWKTLNYVRQLPLGVMKIPFLLNVRPPLDLVTCIIVKN